MYDYSRVVHVFRGYVKFLLASKALIARLLPTSPIDNRYLERFLRFSALLAEFFFPSSEQFFAIRARMDMEAQWNLARLFRSLHQMKHFEASRLASYKFPASR